MAPLDHTVKSMYCYLLQLLLGVPRTEIFAIKKKKKDFSKKEHIVTNLVIIIKFVK